MSLAFSIRKDRLVTHDMSRYMSNLIINIFNILMWHLVVNPHLEILQKSSIPENYKRHCTQPRLKMTGDVFKP